MSGASVEIECGSLFLPKKVENRGNENKKELTNAISRLISTDQSRTNVAGNHGRFQLEFALE